MRSLNLLIACATLGSAAALASADTLLVRDGLSIDGSAYLGTESNWMREELPNSPLSNNAIMRVGEQGPGTVRRSVIRFTDLSTRDLGFTAGQLTGARLLLTTDTAFEGAGDVELRVLGASDENWIENEVSWSSKATGTAWTGGGGTGSNYGPVIDTVSWTSVAGNPSPVSTQLAFDLTGAALAVVQGWIDGSNPDGSFLLRAADEVGTPAAAYVDFYSEDQTAVGQEAFPVLELTYVVPEPASAVLVGAGLALVSLRRRQR